MIPTKNKNILSPSQSIQKSYLRQPVEPKELDRFRSQFEILMSELNPDDREGANKGRVKTFLEKTLWPSESYEVNEAGNSNTDLVIKDKALRQNVVLFEFKKVKSPEMVSRENITRKALYELVLYYVLEEHENKNTDIKHLIISDGYHYFIFEKGLFWDLFGKDKRFVNTILSSERTDSEKRDYIYSQIIKPKVESVKDRLSFTYVDLKDFIADRSLGEPVSKPSLKTLYKLFSPIHLQQLAFSEDHNTLNRKFYTELLYIMGIEERGAKHQIQRVAPDDRQPYSLFEQAYGLLADYESETGDNQAEDSRFDAALGLVIVWINRTLFMKLLESQLIAINGRKKQHAFFEKLSDFGMMHYLFCKVMSIPESERSVEMKGMFADVPYLNSSLFELTDIEQKYFPISSLRNGEIEIMKGSCLKNRHGRQATGKILILDYLKRFLEAYDFGSDAGESGKTIINASVLGLIFEKINGYKEGAFFTPGYITSYICRETLRRCVTTKYNEKYGTKYVDFEELVDNFDYTDKDRRNEVDELISRLRICDPAVGSGHFLVSALNELIVIKRELNVLKTIDGRRFMYRVSIEDDELVVSDMDGELRYNPDDADSQRVQMTLFEEKRKLIENCLFGVDINPNSVEICHLRLWIELLKNAYYINGENGSRHLQTLPNIDINIKSGNALVMKFRLDSPIDQVLRGAQVSLPDYRRHVSEYRGCPSKEHKRKVRHDIDKIRESIDSGYDKETSEYKSWVRVSSEILKKSSSLFAPVEEETKVLTELRKKEARLSRNLAIRNLRYSRLKSFEWRYEYPEILDDKGRFEGFDCIIGNPPYGVSVQGEYRKTVEEKFGHVPDYEIYYYFIMLGMGLLKPNGYMGYIIPNTWLFNQYARTFRQELVKTDVGRAYAWNILELLDCTNIPVFESATVRNTVIVMQKTAAPNGQVGYKNTRMPEGRNDEGKSMGRSLFRTLSDRELLPIKVSDLELEFPQNWGLAFSLTNEENEIIKIIKKNTRELEKFFPEISQGVIAYDQLKGVSLKDIEDRAFHSEQYREGYRKWLRGFDMKQYLVEWNSTPVKVGGKRTDREIYVDYDKIPKARNAKFFNGRRMLVREITNPLIFAAITKEELYHDPAILVVKDNDGYPLELACGILNSELARFYHFRHSPKATKGAFPKIMISDLREFPLPVISESNKEFAKKIIELVREIEKEMAEGMADDNRLTDMKREINRLVFNLYGLEDPEISVVSEKSFQIDENGQLEKSDKQCIDMTTEQ